MNHDSRFALAPLVINDAPVECSRTQTPGAWRGPRGRFGRRRRHWGRCLRPRRRRRWPRGGRRRTPSSPGMMMTYTVKVLQMRRKNTPRSQVWWIVYIVTRQVGDHIFTFGSAVRSSTAAVLQHLRWWSTWLSNKSVVEFGSGGVNFFIGSKNIWGGGAESVTWMGVVG